MTVDIAILTAWNQKLQAKEHLILLLNDNGGCQARYSQCQLCIIKVVYLPLNTMSLVRTLDLGIIWNTTMSYRKYLLRYVLSEIEECTSTAVVVKMVDVVSAIWWHSKA